MTSPGEIVPFHRPYLSSGAHASVMTALGGAHQQGMGPSTERCQEKLAQMLGAKRVLLTQSGTAALEMCALLSRVGVGDEVIMPSYTFVSTANAFVLRGATPVFVDVRRDTLNIDEALIEAAMTPRTKAICVVHYGGVGCDMDAIVALAERHGLMVIEDAAQCIGASWRGRPLGSIGALGAFSFHATKNIGCGEGGALVINDETLVERAEIIWEKGTNRLQHHSGKVDKYRWLDVGSSFLPSEITAAFLEAQLEGVAVVTQRRRAIWERYQAGFADLERANKICRPSPPEHAHHNGHIYFLTLPGKLARDTLQQELKARGIMTATHYVPLHSAPAGELYGRAAAQLPATDMAADETLRLPMFYDLTDAEVDRVIAAVQAALT